MKLAERTISTSVMITASITVAIYNIEYNFQPYPLTLADYILKLSYVSLGSYFGILLLVILPSAFIVGKLERMTDSSYQPLTHRYTLLSDALVTVSCVTITVITLLMWLSHKGLGLN
jgi:hypothetical protein